MTRGGFLILLACALVCLLVPVEAVSSNQRVTNLPYYTGTPTENYVGYLSVRPQIDGHLFYWFVPSEQKRTTDPLIIWINGGPGCTSMIGFFFENGPFRLTSKNTTTDNAFSWHKLGNVLYIDQPMGVGNSYPWADVPGIPTNSRESAVDLFTALNEFFVMFPAYKGRDVYLTGESYAGKYIPHLWNYINENKDKFPATVKGVMLGDAMIKPSVQYTSYPIHGYTAGIFAYRQRVDMNMKYEQCLEDLKRNDITNAERVSCGPLFIEMIEKAGHLSPFDLREPYVATKHENYIIDYFQDPVVRAALSIRDNSRFHKCYSLTHKKFLAEFHADLPDEIFFKLVDNTKLLLYNGQFDLRVSAYGSAEMLRRYNWKQREQFNALRPTVYSISGAAKGIFKTQGNLSHMIIYGGSHMTPVTQPETTYTMIQRFITQNTNLCEPNALDCSRGTGSCPNSCSDHGSCDSATLTCKCRAGFTGSDCSLAVVDVQESSTSLGSATIMGREAVVFQYKLKPSGSMLNVQVNLKRVTDSGLPFVFVNVTSDSLNPTPETVRNMIRERGDSNINGYSFESAGFMAYNVSHASDKVVNMQDVNVMRGLDTVVSVAVFNANDFPVNFTLQVTTEPSKGRVNWTFITVAGSLLMAVIIAMEISVVVARYNRRQRLTKQQYSQILLDDDEQAKR